MESDTAGLYGFPAEVQMEFDENEEGERQCRELPNSNGCRYVTIEIAKGSRMLVAIMKL
jgi:hypothetical protein